MEAGELLWRQAKLVNKIYAEKLKSHNKASFTQHTKRLLIYLAVVLILHRVYHSELTSQFGATWTTVSPTALRRVTVKAVKWQGLTAARAAQSVLILVYAKPQSRYFHFLSLHLFLFLILSLTLTATASFYYLLD